MKAKLPAQSTLGDELVSSMNDLFSRITRGQTITLRTVALNLHTAHFTPAHIRKLRHRLNASQAVMARLLGVSTLTVQSWEQGVRTPSPMAMRLLDDIATNTHHWQQKLVAALHTPAPRKTLKTSPN